MKKKVLSLFLMLIFALSSFSITSYNDIYSQERKYPEINYEPKPFVGYDYTFLEKEALYKPWKIQQNPKTGEIVVFDVGNNCLYVFDSKGKFVRKIGRYGQGPGEFTDFEDFGIDSSGDIFVLDSRNFRLSVFSYDGKLKYSFSIRDRMSFTSMYITNDNILINLPSRGFYFTIFNKKGEIIKDFGEIEKFGKTGSSGLRFDESYARGITIIDSEGNYNIFSSNRFILKRFNKNGELLNSLFLDSFLPELKGYRDKNNEVHWTPPEEVPSGARTNITITSIKYKNNRFYILHRLYPQNRIISPMYTMPLYELDNNLNIIKKYILNFKYDVFPNAAGDLFTYPLNFEILLDSNQILIPVHTQSEILIFSEMKKN
jgi:hypothetical protein